MATIIQATGIEKRFGAQLIFEDASVTLSSDDKVGVIGRNGAGKSTFLRLALGQEELDGGELAIGRGARFGYLEQRDAFDPGESVLRFLARSSGLEEWRCGKVAGRFQLKGPLLDVAVDQLPGGYQTRVKLAAMLLAEPNFLLLDEPTNYLDLRTLVLLERLLDEFAGGFLIVSHDRAFLERTCTKTLEVERARLRLWPGGVGRYLEQKVAEREEDERYNRNIEAKRRELQEFIDKNRVRASTASRAQSKIKELDRLEFREVESDLASVTIRIPDVSARKGTALSLEDLAIGYPERVVARGIWGDLERGEHVAILGDNGQGKTTFLETIAGGLTPRGGAYRWGHGLRVRYYAQHVYSALDANLTVLEYLERQAASDLLRQDVLDLAGALLFRGDDVHKRIDVLSGGERARLALAGVLLSRSDVLLLDEPTNHLDFETVEALAQALAKFRGTVFFVSHDRTFVSLVASSILEVADGRITAYPADYASYVDRVEREADEARDEVPGAAPASSGRSGGHAPGKASREERKERRARMRKVEKDARAAEGRIAKLGEERDEINRWYLSHPTEYSPERQSRLEEIARLVEEEETSWLALEEELEALREADVE